VALKLFITFGPAGKAVASGLYYKSFTIVIYDHNGKESTVNRALGGSTYPG